MDDKGSDTSQQVASASRELRSTAEQIAAGSEEVASRAGTLTAAGEEMAATSGDINRIVVVVHNSSRGAQVTVNAARQLAGMADALQAVVHRFKMT